jgi:hypothetical protein
MNFNQKKYIREETGKCCRSLFGKNNVSCDRCLNPLGKRGFDIGNDDDELDDDDDNGGG